ncbi:MAG: hypothetical protein GY940_12340 [bacterium]|nr:hypothetical protein [bacterium]
MYYLLGPGYISLRKPFLNVPEPEIQTNISSVMVTFGGDDSKNITPRVLAFLERDYPELTRNVVLGSAFKNREAIEAFRYDKVHLFHAPGGAGMRMIMETSDIAISSGGQTLYELARMGVPTVAVTVADNQRDNVMGWEKTGFIESAGLWTDDDLMDNIKKKFRELLDFDCRVRAVEAGRKTVQGNGAKRIIEFIENEY